MWVGLHPCDAHQKGVLFTWTVAAQVLGTPVCQTWRDKKNQPSLSYQFRHGHGRDTQRGQPTGQSRAPSARKKSRASKHKTQQNTKSRATRRDANPACAVPSSPRRRRCAVLAAPCSPPSSLHDGHPSPLAAVRRWRWRTTTTTMTTTMKSAVVAAPSPLRLRAVAVALPFSTRRCRRAVVLTPSSPRRHRRVVVATGVDPRRLRCSDAVNRRAASG